MVEVKKPVDVSQALAQVKAEMLRRQAGGKLPAPSTPDHWPPDYSAVWAWRSNMRAKFEVQPELVRASKAYYRKHPVEFINHWCDTYDPRNAAKQQPVWVPLILFHKQVQLVQFVMACLNGESNGLVEKARDMGVTWVCTALSIWLWLFWDAVAVGWGSRKQELVDRIGDPDSIFEKIRLCIRHLPPEFLPLGFDPSEHMTYMRIVNPQTGSTITGEVGDSIGRGGRKLIYFVDEAAHLEHPEKVEAALLETTRVRIDVSSVSGLGTVFHRKREAGADWVPGQPVEKTRVNVFVMDWQDHPGHSAKEYADKKARARVNGLEHIFAREIDRNYSAATEGVIINAEWVKAAIDAHIRLGIEPSGRAIAGLDVADGGIDTNALCIRRGIVVLHLAEWTERDTGLTTGRAVQACKLYLPCTLEYDANGVGAGVKAELNRLRDEQLIPEDLETVAWYGGAGVLAPLQAVDPDAETFEVPQRGGRNRDFFGNLKAQAWWNVARRFERTYRAVNDPDFTYDPDELISLPSELPLLAKLSKELSQATQSDRSSSLKLIVDKAPEGAKSPNLADALIEAFFPWQDYSERHVSFIPPKPIFA